MALDDIPCQISSVSSSTEESRGATLKDLSEGVEGFGIGCVSGCGSPVCELGGVSSRLDHMDVTEVWETVPDGLAEFGKDLDVVWVGHALEVRVGGETDTDSLLPDGIGACLNDLEGETDTVLDGATVVVGTIVARRLGELVDQVAVCSASAENLDEARCHSRAPCSSTPSIPASIASLDDLAKSSWYRLMSSRVRAVGTALSAPPAPPVDPLSSLMSPAETTLTPDSPPFARPRAQSWVKMAPPLAWTRSVVFFHSLTCS
jgi:hypothetical protein